MKKIYILSTIWMAFIVGACDYNDKNFDGLDDIVKPANVVKEKYTLVLTSSTCHPKIIFK